MNIFRNKTYLVTGGTGSFGSAMVRKLLNKSVKEIRVFSRDETKQEKLRIELKNSKVKFIIGDVRDIKSLKEACEGVDYVFHAAALKQVPSCEFYPMEAIKTNIIGTSNLIEAVKSSSIKKCIFLSTDKSVYPINAMGMTKALMEKVVISSSKNNTKNKIFCITRYGNVMGSRGSVIPLFIQKIKDNEPVTITDPNMTRFLMSLEESVDLVFEALQKGKDGEIFIQKSPASSILNITLALQKIFKPKKFKIKYIGIRHGEKKHEVLISKEEILKATVYNKFYRITSDQRDLNYEKYFRIGDKKIQTVKEYSSANTKFLKLNEVIKLLKKQNFVKNEL
jgi:UDP-N-acetylglucosamine 4,6-dehydratase/5-epimerase